MVSVSKKAVPGCSFARASAKDSHCGADRSLFHGNRWMWLLVCRDRGSGCGRLTTVFRRESKQNTKKCTKCKYLVQVSCKLLFCQLLLRAATLKPDLSLKRLSAYTRHSMCNTAVRWTFM